MIKKSLRDFIDSVTSKGRITGEDVDYLCSDVLADGLTSRVEAEALLALGRSLDASASWQPALSRLVVDFAVWGLKPSGVVSNDVALWLATTLEVGGPSEASIAIAYAILDEAGYVDVALLDFIMRGRQHARLSRLAA